MIRSGAVITGDIVNSTAMGSQATNRLATRLEELVKTSDAKLLSFYRGDSCQTYLADPTSAYSLALRLRTEAKLFENGEQVIETDLKISIGIGGIDTPVADINKAQGAAFVLSGRGLDQLDKKGRRIMIQCERPEFNVAMEAISLFTDYLFSKLTHKQAEVLQRLLHNQTQIETAKELDKSQSTVNRHAQSLGWGQLEELLKLYKECINQITKTNE